MLDLRFLARRKALSAIAVLTMALALGANTAVLSVLKAFLLSGLAVPESDRVVLIAPERDLPGRGTVDLQRGLRELRAAARDAARVRGRHRLSPDPGELGRRRRGETAERNTGHSKLLLDHARAARARPCVHGQ